MGSVVGAGGPFGPPASTRTSVPSPYASGVKARVAPSRSRAIVRALSRNWSNSPAAVDTASERDASAIPKPAATVAATIATAMTISTRVKPPSPAALLWVTPGAVPRAARLDSGRGKGAEVLPPSATFLVEADAAASAKRRAGP